MNYTGRMPVSTNKENVLDEFDRTQQKHSWTSLLRIQNQNVYLYTDPSHIDFTAPQKPAKLVISSKSTQLEIPLSISTQKLKETVGYVQYFLNNKDTVIVSWGLKNLITYIAGRTGATFNLENRIFELSILESYLGEKSPRPASYSEAYGRLSNLLKKTEWNDLYKTYKSVYFPLIQTIPKIEVCGLIHRGKRSKVYPYYEIDGQANGRLNSSSVFSKSYNPSHLSEHDKTQISAPGFDLQFMYFDFKHMEVSVLNWLSKDDYMDEVLKMGDFYSNVWKILTGIEADASQRAKCKRFFLPVIFGMGAKSLAESLNWPLDVAIKIIERMRKTFPVAFAWSDHQQNSLKDGWGVDFFGRRRHFDTPYLVRNFAVQSPAALVCMRKLNRLVEEFPVCMSIHDGYVLYAKPSDFRRTYEQVKTILEQEEDLSMGLKLKVGCHVGPHLSKLEKYEIKEVHAVDL